MAEFYENMKVSLYFMKLEDKYWGLFLIALFVLFYVNGNPKEGKNRSGCKSLLWISLVTSVICICPITAYVLSRFIPFFSEYYVLWHMVPAGTAICSAFVLVADELKKSRTKTIIFAGGVFAVLFFAGNFAYTAQNDWNDDMTFLGKEEAKIYELLETDMEAQGKKQAYLWGPYKIMADSRIYNASFIPIYGKDITETDAVYSETLRSMYTGYSNYEAANSPLSNKEEQVMAIANCLNVFPEITCDYVVMLHPKTQGSGVDPIWIFEALGYEFVGETDSLQLFRRL